jgi:hypothetical protein
LGANLDLFLDDLDLLFLSDHLNFNVDEHSDGNFDLSGDFLGNEDGGSDWVGGDDLFLTEMSVLSRFWVPLEFNCK